MKQRFNERMKQVFINKVTGYANIYKYLRQLRSREG